MEHTAANGTNTRLKIQFVQAYNGDCILISLTENGVTKNILIDGGPGATYQNLKNKKGKPEAGVLQKVLNDLVKNKQQIDLLILTHVDDDHIGGLLRWFGDAAGKASPREDTVKEIWFNSGDVIHDHFKKQEKEIPANPDTEPDVQVSNAEEGKPTSITQGIRFTKLADEYGIKRNGEVILQGQSTKKFGADFFFLSPDESRLEQFLREWKKKEPDKLTAGKEDDYATSFDAFMKINTFEEDKALPNGTSIAFVLNWHGKLFLFLADAHPSVICEGLKKLGYNENNPIPCELVKVAHHGSRNNTSPKLLQMIGSKNYVISTNGDKDQHPHKQLLARLLKHNKDCRIFFNYGERIQKILTRPEDEKYRGNLVPDSTVFEYNI